MAHLPRLLELVERLVAPEAVHDLWWRGKAVSQPRRAVEALRKAVFRSRRAVEAHGEGTVVPTQGTQGQCLIHAAMAGEQTDDVAAGRQRGRTEARSKGGREGESNRWTGQERQEQEEGASRRTLTHPLQPPKQPPKQPFYWSKPWVKLPPNGGAFVRQKAGPYVGQAADIKTLVRVVVASQHEVRTPLCVVQACRR